MIVVGQTIAWGIAVTDATGAPADVGGTVTATVTRPDGTTVAATVSHPGLGSYTATTPATLPGRYRVTWSGTGANSGDLPHPDVADVWPADPRFIIGLADARNALNVPANRRVDDDELLGYIVAATIVVEHIHGPVLAAQVTEHRSGDGKPAIALWQDTSQVVQVTENGVTLPADQWCLDEHALLWRGSTPGAGRWAPGAANVEVRYAIGSEVVPENVRLGAGHLVRHWWTQQQQSYSVSGPIGDDVGITVAGYAVPYMVVDLLRPTSHKLAGMA